eukprot:TRINITY_DN19573_c0_g1::TRINITY_DN19573_c0_g1_i1::g.24601::m.24601 TRINITY_DN19573_c0_g1::TRINITY_DN19573_c0_g1_i1::g.24601  ORF type:complete len:287 (-),score=40.17,sp/Q9Y597/KCTD3_HUMAN/49.12/8e-21,BTB_2/PF02214.17/4.2e-18,BTB/PF00651.26/0.16 TRINITY_DN19573_c0_g1_i1:117-977(-)
MSIVKLNIGGIRYITTDTTLTRGETFFSGLLSGRFRDIRDEEGAYFIDRDGRAFEPILNFLRTGTLDLGQHSVEVVRREATFYCVQEMVDELNRQAVKPKPGPIRFDGYYISQDGQHGLRFKSNGNLIYASCKALSCSLGLTARHLLKMEASIPNMPAMWNQNRRDAETWAKIFSLSIRRGRYTVEGHAVSFVVQQAPYQGSALIGAAHNDTGDSWVTMSSPTDPTLTAFAFHHDPFLASLPDPNAAPEDPMGMGMAMATGPGTGTGGITLPVGAGPANHDPAPQQ